MYFGATWPAAQRLHLTSRLGTSQLQAGGPAVPGSLRDAAELADTVAFDSLFLTAVPLCAMGSFTEYLVT